MNTKHHAEDAILKFYVFHSEIAELPLTTFIASYHQKLEVIEKIVSDVPGERKSLMDVCFQLCGPVLEKSELCRHTRAKPFGYAGDFQIIDWILTNKANSPGTGVLWDMFYQKESACRAVRDRADFFSLLISRLGSNGQKISVLDLACGPCRDVRNILQTIPNPDHLGFMCVDLDANALSYAQSIIPSTKQIEFSNVNVFKLSLKEAYSIVWAGGFFDYLNDHQAVVLLKKMWHWTKSGGCLAFGNFLPSNDSKLLMEWCLLWFLKYRTRHDMIELMSLAGIPKNSISYNQDSSGALGLYTCIKA